MLQPLPADKTPSNQTYHIPCELLPPFDKTIHMVDGGQILLFYKYRDMVNPEAMLAWQKELCARLCLNGKIRIAKEGINGTVGGSILGTEMYITYMMRHPLFDDMVADDFKKSVGSANDFVGLKVKIHDEIVPLGISPTDVSSVDAGKHLTPNEFHQAIEDCTGKEDEQKDSLFVDCRNFYESKIGKFQGALTPDIRKFSYWPEYVDKNEDMFKNKNVYMYCTGGIRCERGSAYLKKKGICKEVYQLKGGIHKYIEEYPDGYYKGKLFVFDNRWSIKSANEDIISGCVYCGNPWDQYGVCSSRHCGQFVLSCMECRSQGLTACCAVCHNNASKGLFTEQCGCTNKRQKIPEESML